MNDLKFEIQDNIAIVNNGKNAFLSLTDFKAVDEILDFYEKIKKNDSIKVLLILNEKGGYSVEAYEDFFKQSESDYRRDELIQAIEINMIRRFILKLINLDKIVIFALSGEVVTPFFGMSLSANFRFSCDKMKFIVNHMNYGQHPSGALPFFLPHYVNQAVFSDLMYRGGEIDNQKALEYGLLNKVFEHGEFHDKCIEEAKKIAELDANVLKQTKKLSQYIVKDLEDYFKIELKMIES